MENTGQNLELLKVGLRGVLKDYGLKDIGISEYQKEANRIIKFALARGQTDYSSDLFDQYLNDIEASYQKGSYCKAHYRFKKRVVRIIRSLAETGNADLSRAITDRSNYPVPDSVFAIIDKTLDDNKIFHPIKRRTMHAVMRHMFHYAHENGYDWMSLDDAIVMKFIVEELPITNGKSLRGSFRCVRLSTDYLRENGLSNIYHDYNQLTIRDDPVSLIASYTEEEIQRIVSTIDLSTPTGKRDYAIILLGYGTALRGIDICRIRLNDIDWAKGSISILQSKTRKPIEVALNATMMNALADYILNSRPECDIPEVFLTVKAPVRRLKEKLTSIMERYCEKADIKKITRRSFHSLRRSFETGLISNGVSLELTSQIAGHANINSDKHYITHNKSEISFVAMDFSDVPINCGFYAVSNGNISARGGAAE